MIVITDVDDPCQVVQRQLDAYNTRDLDAFMSHWDDDAQYFAHPSDLLASGSAEIRERHAVRFREPDLFGHLITRISVGNLVVDREVVTRTFPEGPGRVDVIALYEVEGEKITKACSRWERRFSTSNRDPRGRARRGPHGSAPLFRSLYVIESLSASNEASMMLGDTPTVNQRSPLPSPDSISTRVTASDPPWKMRTL